jgi:hypothetical protein
MPLKFGSTNITVVKYHGISLTKLIYNGTTVFSSAPEWVLVHTGTDDGGYSNDSGWLGTIEYDNVDGSVDAAIQAINDAGFGDGSNYDVGAYIGAYNFYHDTWFVFQNQFV